MLIYLKKVLILTIILSATNTVFSQNKKAEDFGFRHIKMIYKGDSVDILIKSKKGEENIPKPLFLFIQGSLPQPIIITDGEGSSGGFPFNPDIITDKFHLAIVGKPFIPIILDIKELNKENCYVDSNGRVLKEYSVKNLLNYYVNRNIHVIKYLQQQKWISSKKLIVAGHSEGSTIASKIASIFPKVTHLIYSGGNPFGRIMSMIERDRHYETDSLPIGETNFEKWKYITEHSNDLDDSYGDTPKATYEFSNPPILYLEGLKIPVLVSYGTKDWSTPFNDYLRVKMIKEKKLNFHFKAYVGTEHNYFSIGPDGHVNYDAFNWDKVAYDWVSWLSN